LSSIFAIDIKTKLFYKRATRIDHIRKHGDK
jgi:hypothetical protein